MLLLASLMTVRNKSLASEPIKENHFLRPARHAQSSLEAYWALVFGLTGPKLLVIDGSGSPLGPSRGLEFRVAFLVISPLGSHTLHLCQQLACFRVGESYREKGKEGVSYIWLVSLHCTQCHFLDILTVSFPDIPPSSGSPLASPHSSARLDCSSVH